MSDPRRGLHARRIPGVDLALWDVVGTAALVVATARAARWPLWGAAALWLSLAVVAHRVFCVRVRWLTL